MAAAIQQWIIVKVDPKSLNSMFDLEFLFTVCGGDDDDDDDEDLDDDVDDVICILPPWSVRTLLEVWLAHKAWRGADEQKRWQKYSLDVHDIVIGDTSNGLDIS